MAAGARLGQGAFDNMLSPQGTPNLGELFFDLTFESEASVTQGVEIRAFSRREMCLSYVVGFIRPGRRALLI